MSWFTCRSISRFRAAACGRRGSVTGVHRWGYDRPRGVDLRVDGFQDGATPFPLSLPEGDSHDRTSTVRSADPEVPVIRVLVADDHELVRTAIVDLLNSTGDMTVVAECSDGDEVVEAVLRTSPDVVLLDQGMPRMPGLDAARALLAVQPGARVVMPTGALSAASVTLARRLDLCGYLLKGEAPDQLPQQLRTVAAGGTAWSRTAVLA